MKIRALIETNVYSRVQRLHIICNYILRITTPIFHAFVYSLSASALFEYLACADLLTPITSGDASAL